MNRRERNEFKPLCERCGRVVTDIDWFDTTIFGRAESFAIGRMRCSADGCYGIDGSRITNAIVLGGLTMAELAWLRAMSVRDE